MESMKPIPPRRYHRRMRRSSGSVKWTWSAEGESHHLRGTGIFADTIRYRTTWYQKPVGTPTTSPRNSTPMAPTISTGAVKSAARRMTSPTAPMAASTSVASSIAHFTHSRKVIGEWSRNARQKPRSN